MFKITRLRVLSLLASIAVILLVTISIPVGVGAQCLPVAYEQTFQKVYRQHKVFIDGVADLTGDGKPDAYGYQLQPNSTYQNIVVLPNNGSGGFGDPIISATTFPISNDVGRNYGYFYGSVTIGDLNNDGKPDAVVRGSTSPLALFTMINDGSGRFTQTAASFANGEYIHSIADLNGDGRGDLVAMGFGQFYDTTPTTVGSSIAYRMGNADGTFSERVFLDMQNLIGPAVADFNGDGKVDIAYSYYSANTPAGYDLKVLTNLGGGIFSGPAATRQDVAIARASDLNNDGKPDLVATTHTLMNNGSGVFTKTQLPATPAPGFPTTFLYSEYNMSVLDYEGDGDRDILAELGGRSNLPGDIRKSFYSVFINDGAGNYTRVNFDRRFPGIPVDITGDGKADAVNFVNSIATNQRLSATNEMAVIVSQPTCTAPPVRGQTRLLDFRGDGSSDIVSWNQSNGQWSFLSNVYSGNVGWGSGALGDIPSPGDFDGDGKTDAAVYRNSTGVWWILKSSDGTWISMAFGITGDIPVPADYNGDGRSDIAVFRPADGNWYIFISGSGQVIITHFGLNGDKPVQQDYDGDGKTDIAVYRPSTGIWYYLKSSDGNFIALNWGISTDIPVPADFDMDGKADVTVFRQGTWYILRSFDYNYEVFQFGINGDLPMAVDSNGDGIMEIAVNRNANVWFASPQPQLLWANFVTSKPIRILMPNN